MRDEAPKKPNILLRLLALVVTAALVLGALVLVVYRDKLNVDALERWLTARQIETDQSGQPAPFTYAGGDMLRAAFLEKGVLFSSAAGAHYYALSGQLYAEQVVDMDSPVLSACAKAGVVYDAGEDSLYLFRGGQQTLELTLDGDADILSARPNDAGWLAVTAQQSGYKGAVTVYDAQGEKAIQISLSSTFVVDAALSPNSKSVAVVTISQSGGIFDSQVLFYPTNKTEPSARIDLGNLVVLDMDYESDRLWLVCSDRVVTLDPDSGDVCSYPFGHRYLKGYSLEGDGFAMLLLSSYSSGSADEAVTLDPDCGRLARMSLSGQILDFDCAGPYAAILTGGDLTVYDRVLSTQFRLDDTAGARYTALRQDGCAVLADRQQCWFYIPD